MRRFKCFIWLLALAVVTLVPLPARADGPTTSPTWGDSASSAAEGGGAAGGEVRVGTDARKTPMFGQVGCPVFLVEQDVYSVKTLAHICTLESAYPSNNRHAISPDGKLFAVSSVGQNQEGGTISVYDLATGAKDATLTPSGQFADAIVFGHGVNLFVGGRDRDTLEQFDAITGKLIRTITLPAKNGPRGPSATTADGRYFALPCDDRIILFSGTDGSPVCKLNPPIEHREATAEVGSSSRTPGKISHRSSQLQHDLDENRINMDSIFFNAWIDGMAFSPNGQELAVTSSEGRHRLVIWSHTGAIVGDVDLGSGVEVPLDQTLSWSPDCSMLLIRSNRIVDRKSLQTVMRGRPAFGQELASIFLDNDQLVAYTPQDGGCVRRITLPISAMKKSLAAMTDEKTPAKLRPGSAVAIQVQMGDLKGDGRDASDAVTAAVTSLLEREGFNVDPTSKLIMVARFAEKTGKDIKVYEKENPFQFGPGRDTGQTVQDYHSTVDLALWATGDSKPIWFDSADAGSGREFSTAITNDTMRKSMLDRLKSQIEDLHLPTYVPSDPAIDSLPIDIKELSATN